MARVHVTMPDYQHRQFKHLARMAGQDVSKLIQQALSDFWDSQTEATQATIRLAMRSEDEATVLAAARASEEPAGD
jgi:predicted transcriptional regulator